MPRRRKFGPPRMSDLYPLPWLLSAALLAVGYLVDTQYGGQGDEALRPTLAIVERVDALLAISAIVVGLGLLCWRLSVRLIPRSASARTRERKPHAAFAPWALPVGLVLCAGTLLFGLLDAIVLLPQATAPAHTTVDIYSAIVDTFGPSSLVVDLLVPLAWLVFWGVVLSVVAVVLWRASPSWNYVLAALFGLAGVAIPYQFFASAPLSMDIADALPPGYGTLPAATFYFWIGGRVMLCAALVLLALRPGSSIRRH